LVEELFIWKWNRGNLNVQFNVLLFIIFWMNKNIVSAKTLEILDNLEKNKNVVKFSIAIMKLNFWCLLNVQDVNTYTWNMIKLTTKKFNFMIAIENLTTFLFFLSYLGFLACFFLLSLTKLFLKCLLVFIFLVRKLIFDVLGPRFRFWALKSYFRSNLYKISDRLMGNMTNFILSLRL
jgi:hypothetical protein